MLPALIRERSGKGHFNEVFFGGLARNLPLLETLVEQAPVDDLGIVDKDELLRRLHKAALGVGECRTWLGPPEPDAQYAEVAYHPTADCRP